MRKFYCIALTFLMVTAYQSKAQTGFNFNCARDTVINGCTATCITLKSRIPDIRSSTNSYVVNQLSGAGTTSTCFAPYVDPGTPGPAGPVSADDTYSDAKVLPFSFPFFGTPYNSVVLSTNGYLSFDATLALGYSHWTTAPGNLPNTGYDRALIMGPYHDLDPVYTTSPSRIIKYETLGTAPHRRFVFSFYKVPLFTNSGGGCDLFIENTHQIVLYEGVGIVEVFIKDMQICTGWNSGKAMVGMQNYNRNAAIMAPGRKVSDPAWGSIGMNESWRFTPATGPTLYRKVELFDLATGALVATGDTTSIGNNIFEVAFPNVCPTTTTSYIVRSTYQDINNPASFVYGSDTVRVVRSNAIGVGATVDSVKCNGNNDGSFTITPIGGTGPFKYSIDAGANYQTSPTFPSLAGGVYNVRILDEGSTCIRDTVITVFEPEALTATVEPANATCSATANGTITITGGGGVAGYDYSLDGTLFQASNVFHVTNGSYTVTIRDANHCIKTYPVTVDLTNDLTLSKRNDTTICKGASLQLTTISNAASYSWSPVTDLNNATIGSPIATPATNTIYTVTATLGQCTKTASIDIKVKQEVQVDAGLPVFVISGDQAQLFGTAVNATSYLWTPATGLSSATTLSPVVQPTATTLYTLTVKNDVGCTASDDVLVTVIPYCVKVKNAFTPNGDGINDQWLVYESYECLKNVTVHVFNRYGNEVYSSKDYRNNWDGRYKGKSLPDATYYAVVDFVLVNGKTFTVKSDLTILR